MRLFFFSLPSILTAALAAEYAIDPECELALGPGVRDGIISGMKEAVELAENALEVLNQHESDVYVQNLIRYLYGIQDRDQIMDRVKGKKPQTHLSATPSALSTNDEAWFNGAERSSNDVGLYCSNTRLIPHPTKPALRMNKHNRPITVRAKQVEALFKCHNHDAVLEVGTNQRYTKALTMGSYTIDLEAFKAAPGAPPLNEFKVGTGHPANIDICSVFIRQAALEGWPLINEERIARIRSETFINGMTDIQRPVDGIKTFGVTMFHELTHANIGGFFTDADDIMEGEDPKCFNWISCTRLSTLPGGRTNSDTAAILVMLLKAWRLGYYVDQDGFAHPRI
ncbi:uncharacterized protein B0I36DRAFT_364370 [Microdochium trichocladiopsis]|uniref:Lysine-specific metallo-endopeptidase domain-containing protein n=1 Tax=Microdochium trichocladiopsis TaxID=1682393 RepID=A0A9P8Y5W6_9PEZI|nr:uncharacterized protein B0I36DRAFT_364370 [Microdochium trichocladiopsis]KAH7029900.1 hypothetical protein B0I36DRAFT_364370 [Microdochium trichocladiopsis]